MTEREKTEAECERGAKRRETVEATVKKSKRYRYKYINIEKNMRKV